MKIASMAEASGRRSATVTDQFVEEAADSCAQRPGHNECGPEQRDPGDTSPAIGRCDHRQCGAEHQRAAFVSEAGGIGHPVTERRSQCL